MSADIITIATAIHWIDNKLFYEEEKRILKSKGVIAVWTYRTTCEIDPVIDNLINTFSEKILNEHWDSGIKQVWNFDEINFPFKQINCPDFEIKLEWTCDDFLNYLYTWSSVHKYIEVHNSNPLNLLKEDITKIWGDNFKRKVIWKIKMKAGKL